jgi:tryptophan-rich sensory protein
LGAIVNVLRVWAALGGSLFILSRLGNSLGSEAVDGPRAAPWTPPGAFIGAAWLCLYSCMGLSLWMLNRLPDAIRDQLRLTILAH